METAAREKETRVVRAVLAFSLVASGLHYTDNYLRFARYPQPRPPLIGRSLIWEAWLAFTILAGIAYLLHRRGRRGTAVACLGIYSTSGLIGPLHYLYGSLAQFDAVQHAFIALDTLAGLSVLATAVWLELAHR